MQACAHNTTVETCWQVSLQPWGQDTHSADQSGYAYSREEGRTSARDAKSACSSPALGEASGEASSALGARPFRMDPGGRGCGERTLIGLSPASISAPSQAGLDQLTAAACSFWDPNLSPGYPLSSHYTTSATLLRITSQAGSKFIGANQPSWHSIDVLQCRSSGPRAHPAAGPAPHW